MSESINPHFSNNYKARSMAAILFSIWLPLVVRPGPSQLVPVSSNLCVTALSYVQFIFKPNFVPGRGAGALHSLPAQVRKEDKEEK